MNKVEKIKAEIERLKNELIQEVEKSYKLEFDEGRISAFEDMITLINSFEEEPISNDLEEAAHSYVDTTIEWFDSEGNPCCYPAFIAGAQWQQQKTDRDMTEALRTEYEKGRADVIADTLSWLANCWPRYCSNQTIIEGFKEAIKGE